MIRCYEKIQNASTPELLVYDYIGMGGVDAKEFRQDLNELTDRSAIVNVRFNSEGGDVFAGSAIYNAIRESKATIRGFVDGVAASIASYDFLATHERYMASNAFLMLHKIKGGAFGESSDMRKRAELMDKVENILAARLSELSGNSEEWVRNNWLKDKEDTWFNAEEALEAGLIDGITDAAAPDVMVNKNEAGVQPYQMALINRFQNQLNNPSTDIQSQTQNGDMKLLAALCNKYGIQANLENDQEMKAALESKLDDLKNRAQTAEKEKQDLETEKEKLENKLTEQEKNNKQALIDQAVTDGKLSEKQKKAYESIAETSTFEALKNVIENLPQPTANLKNVKGLGNGKPEGGGKGAAKFEGKSMREIEREKGGPEYLRNLYKTDFEAYADLYEEEYGNRPKA